MNATRRREWQDLRPETLYYDRDGVRVTRTYIVVPDDVYPVAQVRAVWVRRRMSGGGGLLLATLLPAAALGMLITWQGASSFLAGAVLATVLSVAGVAITLGVRLWPRTHEVWINLDGDATRAFATNEEWRAGQLARAVHRAAVAWTDGEY
jgi:hypothetical protein